jgi:UDP-2,3-diacylglucosamine pyrophosphatase LpxH
MSKILIISDLHLGSVYAREKLLLDMLNTIEYDEVILAGDVIDFIKVPHFTPTTLLIIEKLCQYPVTYVYGNHDIAFEKFADKHLRNIFFCDRHEFVVANRKFVVEHGHKYESGILRTRLLMNFIGVVGDIIERIFNFNMNFVHDFFLTRKKRIQRIWNIIDKNKSADVFIMGHTHNPEVLIWVDKDERIRTYVNTGDWVENATYVIIDAQGQLRLRNYLKS